MHFLFRLFASLHPSRWLYFLALLASSAALLSLHLWPDQPATRLAAGGAIMLAYLVFCGATYTAQRHKSGAITSAKIQSGSVLVVYASQTGYAEQLAQQTATALQQAGMAVQCLPLAQLDGRLLQQTKKILFIVSTSGEGDAPDHAAGFVRKLMRQTLALPELHFGILALGDRHYQHYCAFGHRLQHWLHQQQANNLFDLVEVDRADQGALRHWQYHLDGLSGSSAMADWRLPTYHPWILTERRLLNPGSAGAPAYHLALAASATDITWQAGDIAEIGAANARHEIEAVLVRLQLSGSTPVQTGRQTQSLEAHLATRLLPQDNAAYAKIQGLPAQALADALAALPHREYSIASLPSDGTLELMVRQVRQANGKLGLGSGWLTHYASTGGEIALRIRENRSFHAPDDDRALILIGNGTGLAGLRAHLKQREQKGQHRNWLFFGERNVQHDYFYKDEMAHWLAKGVLQKLDLAFSRDQPQRLYVQDPIAAQAAAIKVWVKDGAAIYVCGSLAGMAAAVSATLAGILGAEQLEAMAEDGRYRRDVY